MTNQQTCDCFDALASPDPSCNFGTLNSAAKTAKTKCNSPNEPGSFGDCTKVLKADASVFGKCKSPATDPTEDGNCTCTSTSSTTTTSATNTFTCPAPAATTQGLENSRARTAATCSEADTSCIAEDGANVVRTNLEVENENDCGGE